jgi:hypothetical protein
VKIQDLQLNQISVLFLLLGQPSLDWSWHFLAFKVVGILGLLINVTSRTTIIQLFPTIVYVWHFCKLNLLLELALGILIISRPSENLLLSPLGKPHPSFRFVFPNLIISQFILGCKKHTGTNWRRIQRIELPAKHLQHPSSHFLVDIKIKCTIFLPTFTSPLSAEYSLCVIIRCYVLSCVSFIEIAGIFWEILIFTLFS